MPKTPAQRIARKRSQRRRWLLIEPRLQAVALTHGWRCALLWNSIRTADKPLTADTLLATRPRRYRSKTRRRLIEMMISGFIASRDGAHVAVTEFDPEPILRTVRP